MGVIKVENYDVTIANTVGATSLTNSVGDINSGFVRVISSSDKGTGPTGSAGNAAPNNVGMGAFLQSPNIVAFQKTNATSVRQMGEVWRYTGPANGPDEFIVRGRFQVTVSTNSNSVTVPNISDRNKCIPILNGYSSTSTSTSDYEKVTVACHINSSGDLVVSRNNTGGATVTAYVTVVEFTGGNWSVGHGVSSNHDSVMENVVLRTDSTGVGGNIFDVGDWSNATILDISMEGDSSETGLADVQATCIPVNTTTVSFGCVLFDAGARNDGTGYIHVLKHDNLIVNRGVITNLAEGNGTTGTISFPAGASLTEALDELSMEWFVGTSGVGTAHARGRLTSRITSSSGTITHWVHRSGNTVRADYGILELANITGVANLNISDVDGDEIVTNNQTNVVITGLDFGNLQGSGKVELVENSDYTGTIINQSIVNWSDTSITININSGILSDSSVFLFVTNDSSARGFIPLTVGIPPKVYDDFIEELAILPNHWWKLQNSYDDSIGSNPMTTDIVGGGGFLTTPIVDTTTHSWVLTDVLQRRGCADSSNMNITTAFQERTMGGWIMLGGIQQSLGCVYKEGGAVNNLAFLTGVGNILMAQLADTSDDNAQAYSDFRLEPNRPYHIMFRYSYNETPREFRLFIDGIEQQKTDGNPLTATDLDTHSGDINWGDPDANLETGGTDISYNGQENCYYSHWYTWTTALDKTTVIREQLFESGALPDVVITSDTQINMQAQLDTYANSEMRNYPLTFKIEPSTDGSDLELIANNIRFNPSTSLQIKWLGDGDLTWVLENGSSVDDSKFSTPNNGNIIPEQSVLVKLTVLDIDDNSPVVNANVLIEATNGGDLSVGEDIIKGFTDVNGEIFTNIRISNNQPIVGRVRRATSGTLYKETPISGTILTSGFDETIFLINDE